jgi:hypothetical protein
MQQKTSDRQLVLYTVGELGHNTEGVINVVGPAFHYSRSDCEMQTIQNIVLSTQKDVRVRFHFD